MFKFLGIFSFIFFLNLKVLASETTGVITTIQPINSLVSSVIGNTGKTISLIPSQVSPHEYKLKPSDIKKLQNANIIFFVSHHLETRMTKVFKNLPKNIKIINLMENSGIKNLAIRDNQAWERNDHQHKNEVKDRHYKYSKKHNDHNHYEKEDDVHIWLSPDNAVKIIQKVNKELSLIFPENDQIFKQNANQMITKIKQLKIELKNELSSIRDKPYVVFHDAYQYFENRFGVSSAGALTLNPDVLPGAKQIDAIQDLIQDKNIKCIFSEPQYNPKIIETLAADMKISTGIMDPLGAFIDQGPEMYQNLILDIANSLKDCGK